MIQKVINGIMGVLYTKYPLIPRTDVKTLQGFTKATFYVRVLNTIQTPKLQPRLDRQYLVDVHYFPNEGVNMEVEARGVQDELLEALEWITVDGHLVKGLNISAEYQNEVLHVFATYNIPMVKDVIDDDLMTTLIIE